MRGISQRIKEMKRNNFTLIEMIAVVAIASILIAVFVPSFNRMMFGSKVDQAASNFKLGLEMAQARAIAARKYVAMVIPTVYGDASTSLKAYCDGGYRLAFAKKSGGNYHFSGWVPDSSWRNPRDGAALTQVSGLSDLQGSASSFTGNDADQEDWDRLGGSTNRKAVIFSPYGGVAGSSPSFTFTEAKFTGDTKSDGTAVYDMPNADNRISLSVNHITGRVTYQ